MEEYDRLKQHHLPEAIEHRLALPAKHFYLGDVMLGAIDGCVTTFAIIAGAAGAGFTVNVAITLGFANLFADGFSMAVSNYQNVVSKKELLDKARREEEKHIEIIPKGEKEEVRQIFANKGFQGKLLQDIVNVITKDKKLWVDTMIKEELGLATQTPEPFFAAISTFFSFLIVGTLPILPLLIFNFSMKDIFFSSAIITAFAFFIIGCAKGFISQQSIIKSGVSTLLMGGCAAMLAFLIGMWLQESLLI
jgi:VIT1/CCC1 family predicted Fe2+/Mn2+ transporter